ncbi:MAG: exodeoxyribonuclease VII large subunit, partial [Terriglobales bacterium]
RRRLERLGEVLGDRDPLRILGRGYALIYGAQGRLAARSAAVAPGEALRIRFADGWLDAQAAPKNPRDTM